VSSNITAFYPIVENCEWVERIVPLGVKTIQLRNKGNASSIQDNIVRAQKICDTYNCQLIVNDHWQLAIDLNCNYIHLGQEDLENADIKAIQKHNLKIGISTHSHEELEIALVLDPDYIALGPIFGTTSKELEWQEQGLERINEWKKLIGAKPLIAIGGITLENASSVYAAGANSIAVISDITKNKEPEQRAHDWLKVGTQNG